jgi:indolepyruvate ferredoxin oxidoreductase, beta subunit
MSAGKEPIAVLIGALGGQGGGVLTEWLVELATRAGYVAQATSIPGVAQRTGATTYYIEVYPVPLAELGDKRPVLGLYPVPGRVDLVVASELLEALRIVQSGNVDPTRTMLVASTARALTTIEKMAQGDGRLDTDRLLDVARRTSRTLVAFDMERAAREAGTVVSAVMFGAIAGSGVLPFQREAFEEVIRAAGVGVDGSLRGFASGYAPADFETSVEPAPSAVGDQTTLDEFPGEVRDIVALGLARQREFQDRAYADLYRARVACILAAERGIDPSGGQRFAMTREAARFLALWMAFDDVVRVADLKSRKRRFARVRQEVAATERDIVRVIDFFKPGVPEFAGMLPQSIADKLARWDRQRQGRGKAPLAWPLQVRSDSISGAILLRTLAALKTMRRSGARYRREQAEIDRWLDSIADAARTDWSRANELALCGRLVKGYGTTNERGRRNLAHILDHLAKGDAVAVRDARIAALGDEAGKAFDETMQRHGAPPRPVVARPIAWTPRRGNASHTTQ